MKTEEQIWQKIKKLEEQRDEYHKSSAEHIELQEKIDLLLWVL